VRLGQEGACVPQPGELGLEKILCVLGHKELSQDLFSHHSWLSQHLSQRCQCASRNISKSYTFFHHVLWADEFQEHTEVVDLLRSTQAVRWIHELSTKAAAVQAYDAVN